MTFSEFKAVWDANHGDTCCAVIVFVYIIRLWYTENTMFSNSRFHTFNLTFSSYAFS